MCLFFYIYILKCFTYFLGKFKKNKKFLKILAKTFDFFVLYAYNIAST